MFFGHNAALSGFGKLAFCLASRRFGPRSVIVPFLIGTVDLMGVQLIYQNCLVDSSLVGKESNEKKVGRDEWHENADMIANSPSRLGRLDFGA